MFFEYIWLACTGMLAGRLIGASTCTPWATTVSPALVMAQFPPLSEARSTITDPGRIDLTISSVISSGAVRPGICAVVMTMSTCGMAVPMSASSLSCCSSLSSFA